MDFRNLEVIGELKSILWTFGRRVVKAQTNQVELNDIGSQGFKDSMHGWLIKGVLLSRETHKLGCARWNGVQNQKVFFTVCAMLTERSSRDRIFDTTEKMWSSG